MQPFLTRDVYQSSVWRDFYIRKKEDHLLFHYQNQLFDTVSSGVVNGGFSKSSHFINWKVPLDYQCGDPMKQTEEQMENWGYPIKHTVGLQTAANIHRASVQEVDGDHFKLVCCVTVGLGNRARAGVPRQVFSSYDCGTINIFLFINGHLSQSAMVNAIITATEAKAAALQELEIVDENGEYATGTTTDSVVLASTQVKEMPMHLYAGTATTIGNAVGILVYKAICESALNKGVR